MNRLLLIGNWICDSSEYAKLDSVPRDLDLLERIFCNLEYEITRLENYCYEDIRVAISEYKKKISELDNVIIYFSGHGFHKDSHNFLVVKDTIARIDSGMNSEYYESFYRCVDVNELVKIAECNSEGNTLIIVDACRVNNIDKFESLKEIETSENIAWQLYSTSFGQYSFANGLFSKAIEKVIYREEQNISDLFESIRCYMVNNCFQKEYQAPILISGRNNFRLIENMNDIVENKYYDELIKLYCEVKKLQEKCRGVSKNKLVEQIVSEVNYEFCMPKLRIQEIVTRIVCDNGACGLIDFLTDEQLKDLVVYRDRIILHGVCGNYLYDNVDLYSYDTCWGHIRKSSISVERFVYKYGKFTCLNYAPCSSEDCFTLIIRNEKNVLSYYVDEYYKDDSIQIMNLNSRIDEIFRYQKNCLIVGRCDINALSFLHSLLSEKILRTVKVYELIHLTRLEKLKAPVDGSYYDEVFENRKVFNNLIDRIKAKQVDCLVIPVTAYHNSMFTEERRKILEELMVETSKGGLQIFFYTDYMENAISRIHITKQVLRYVQEVFCLDKKNDRTYLQAIKKKEEFVK